LVLFWQKEKKKGQIEISLFTLDSKDKLEKAKKLNNQFHMDYTNLVISIRNKGKNDEIK